MARPTEKTTVNHPQTIREWTRDSWNTAEEKGWHDKEPTKDFEKDAVNISCKIANIHGEVSEAHEELKVGKKDVYYEPHKPKKPCGFGIELADIMIRVKDLAHSLGIDLQKCMELKAEYNRTRSYRHGNKRV